MRALLQIQTQGLKPRGADYTMDLQLKLEAMGTPPEAGGNGTSRLSWRQKGIAKIKLETKKGNLHD